jgi:PAS domain S-box-containing protein
MHLPGEDDKYFWLFRNAGDSFETTTQIQNKEQYLTDIFRSAPVGIGVLHDNTIFYSNQYLSDITGYIIPELAGSSLDILFDNNTEYENVISLLHENTSNLPEIEVVWKNKEGNRIFVKLNFTAIDTNIAEKRYTFSVIDITESKKAQQQLMLSETRYRKLIQEAADAIIIIQANKGLIIEANKKAEILTGYPVDSLIGSHISMIFPREVSPEYFNLYVSEEWTQDHRIARAEIFTRDKQFIKVEINNRVFEDVSGKVIIGFYRDLTDRQLWEKKLTESEQRYKTLFNSVKEGIIIADVSSNKMILVNETICNWFDYILDEITGQSVETLLNGDSFALKKLNELIILDSLYLQNYLCKTKRGEIIYVDIRSSAIQIDEKGYTALYLTNVTERYEQQLYLEKINQELRIQDDKYRQLNEELQKSYINLSAVNRELEVKSNDYLQLFNEMVSGFAVHEMIYDENGNPCDYRYLAVNPAFEKLTGLKSIEIVGKSIKEVIPTIEEYWINTFGEVAKTGTPVSYENYAEELGKYYETVAYSPGKDKFAVVFNDITQRVKSRDELDKIFNLSLDLICIASFDGYFIKTNPAFHTILGFSMEELKSQKLWEFILESDRGITRKVFMDELARDNAINNFQNRLVTSDGKIVWISWAAQPLTKDKTIFAIGRNITDQKKAEGELISAKEKAIESDRLKSAFLANMSHEVRTPMNAIIGFSSLLDINHLEADKRRKYTQIIRSRCDDLLRIIDDILDISRIEAGQVVINPEDFVVNNLMQEILEIHKQRIINLEKTQLGIELQPLISQIILHNDRQRLLQIMNNLIDNAIKFTLEGKVTFGCREYVQDKVLFFVTDTGIGIPKEKHQVIFQRFRQAEENLTRKFGGNGLGLAISKPLIQLMGGNIWLESESGKGSTFYFTVDKYLGQQELTELIKLKDKRILVVEDDRHSVDYFRILLEQLGAVISHARSGNESLTLLEAGAKYDLILMDIQLTDISGIEVTRAIRKFDMQTPIIAETAYARAEDRQNCLDAGCNDFIAKPVDDEDLIKLLLKYIDK